MQDKNLIGIAGAGTMGTGIAHVFSSMNFEVILFDNSSKAIENSKSTLEKIISSMIERGKLIRNEGNRILQNICYSDVLSDFEKCGVIIEAIIEDKNQKQNLFRMFEEIASPECILATNTSSLSVTSIASACRKPERVIGTHFFNPAYIMPLVEVVPGLLTHIDVVNNTTRLMKDLGKNVVVTKDTPGFIVNRIARPFYGEALRILEEGIADIPTIDQAMKEIGKFKMGPFELMDLIGIDVNYMVTSSVFEAFYFDPKYKPSLIQKRYVDAKMLGKKSGRGFYNYNGKDTYTEPVKDIQLAEKIFYRIISMLINEAADAVLFNIASINDIDLAMTKGVNYPKGLLKWADELGLNNILNTLNNLYYEYNEDRYRPCPLLKRMVKENKTFYLNTDH